MPYLLPFYSCMFSVSALNLIQSHSFIHIFPFPVPVTYSVYSIPLFIHVFCFLYAFHILCIPFYFYYLFHYLIPMTVS
jgi:hypothetical protein